MTIMEQRIQITKTQSSGLHTVNFDDIPFGRVFADHMFVADYKNGQWGDYRIVPFGPFSIHPALMALHYGQSIFEGMKASKAADGTPMLFRPEMHARRLNRSAERLVMPTFPEADFVEVLKKLVALDADWIPTNEGSALYIRPYMFATDEFIGVRPSETYRLIIFSGPVGPYYPKPVRLLVEQHYVRAVPGGTGEAKAAGNYAGSLYPAKLAQQKGFDQVMWMGGPNMEWVQEVGTMNIFFVIDGKLVTPATDGAILRGITRDSVLIFMKDQGYTIEERPVSIHEIVEAYENNRLQECFGAGTAAVVSHVSHIALGERVMELPSVDHRPVGEFIKSYINGLRAGRIEDTYGWNVPAE